MSNCSGINFTYCTLSMAICLCDLEFLLNGVALKGKQSCSPTKKVKCTQRLQSFSNPCTQIQQLYLQLDRQPQQAVTSASVYNAHNQEKRRKKAIGERRGD